ncbi:MAG: holo-ACP synthase [Candidatus Izemoplasmataceae bacterium]
MSSMNSVGIDIVEIEAIKKRYNLAFVKRILSEDELVLFNAISSESRKLEFLAGRFAAKEAYTKVYKHFDKPLNFKDVSILKDEFGAPFIQSLYHKEDCLMISISHSEHYAIAIVIKK